jgi:hypothetical protein
VEKIYINRKKEKRGKCDGKRRKDERKRLK